MDEHADEPADEVPLIRMNCRSRPTCSSIPLGRLLAVPAVDRLVMMAVSSAP